MINQKWPITQSWKLKRHSQENYFSQPYAGICYISTQSQTITRALSLAIIQQLINLSLSKTKKSKSAALRVNWYMCFQIFLYQFLNLNSAITNFTFRENVSTVLIYQFTIDYRLLFLSLANWTYFQDIFNKIYPLKAFFLWWHVLYI